jgi:hypothetical protein
MMPESGKCSKLFFGAAPGGARLLSIFTLNPGNDALRYLEDTP